MDVDPKTLRAWGRLLSTLLQTPDEELGDFVRERLEGCELSEASLKHGRDLLTHLGRALEHPSPERWTGIQMAADTLEHWEAALVHGDRPPQEPTETAGPSPAPVDAAAPAAPPPAPPLPAVAPAPRIAPAATPDPSPWAPGGPTPAGAAADVPAAPRPFAPVAGAAQPPLPPTAASQPPPPPMAASQPPPPPTAASQPPPRQAQPMDLESELMRTLGMTDAPPPDAVLPFEGQVMPRPALLSVQNGDPEFGTTAPGGRKKGPTTPFQAVPDQRAQASGSEPPPGFTLQRYAAFCTERSLWPRNTEGRLVRFGLTEQAAAQVDAYYRRLFAKDPSQRHDWLRLCQAHQKMILPG